MRMKILPDQIDSGTPERIRTSDLLLRRQTLYPAELRARKKAHTLDLQNRFEHELSGPC